jgi:hypothetical protein
MKRELRMALDTGGGMTPPVPGGRDPRLFSGNRGRAVPLQTAPDPAGSGNLVVTKTQLIADTDPRPNREWIITVAPLTMQGNPTVPWNSSFDGTDTTPAPGTNFSAPNSPDLQCLLQFGSGGVYFSAAFDYPYQGGNFGVSADQVNFGVIIKPGSPDITFPPADVGNLPVVGAFMSEGVSATPTPLRWMELVPGPVGGSAVYWPVRPYARELHIVAPTATATTDWFVTWCTASGGAMYTEKLVVPAGGGLDVFLDVPAAFVVNILNAEATPVNTYLVWEIGFM